MSLMDKKISELTSEDKHKLRKPIGVGGLAFPMMRHETTGKNGEVKQTIGKIDSVSDSLAIYTEMNLEKLTGKVYRDMPIPSMLPMFRDLLAKQSPTSKNRIFTVFGDAAFGKSFLFKSVSSMVHPKGAIHVDCGGMNMREIFFRTVIDYGEGVKEAFEKKLEKGEMSKASIDYINTNFPDTIISKNNETHIDWAMFGTRKQYGTGEDKKETTEDRGESFKRANEVLKEVYEREGLTTLTNSFGIKTVPGEFFEALEEGRPLFLDEFNKHREGTLDCWQTALQVLNGEENSINVYNPMSQSGGDDIKFLTINREDFKTGFIVGLAGNEGKDGSATKELSESMMTRLNPMYVGNPTELDWKHRESQIWTGVPLTTLYHLYKDFANNKPDEFAEFLIDIRKLGLDDKEINLIPAKEIYFLQNWKDTVESINKVSQYRIFRNSLANPESKLFESKKYEALSDELASDAAAKQISISFRKLIAEHNKAIEGTPAVSKLGENNTPDIKAAFDTIRSSGHQSRDPGWYRFGDNLSRAIVEDIINVTKDMPLTRSTLLETCVELGILESTFNEAKKSKDMKLLSDLMKYDDLKDIGGTDELKAMQNVIVTMLRSMNSGIQASDDDIVSLRNLGAILNILDAKYKETKGELTKEFNSSLIGNIIIPNDDLNEVGEKPLLEVATIANYNYTDSENELQGETVNFSSILAAMAMPEFSDKNRENILLGDFLSKVENYKKDSGEDLTREEKEVYKILTGESSNGFDMAIVAAKDSKGDETYLYVIEDKLRKRSIIIGTEDISVPLSSSLDKNGLTYLVQSDNATGKKIDQFVTEGTKERHEKNQFEDGASYEISEQLIEAISSICEVPENCLKHVGDGDEKHLVIKEGTTLGSIISNIKEKPMYFTKIIKRPKLKM